MSLGEFAITPVDPVLGAEVTGLDLNRNLAEAEIARLQQALASHGLLIFRQQQNLTPAAQVAFSRRWGPLEIHVQKIYLLPDHPEILIVSNVVEDGRRIGLADAGHYWHADLSYLAEPSLGSLLVAKELPPEGGDTLFANQIAAYEALDPATKAELDGLLAVHDYGSLNRRQVARNGVRPALNAQQAAQVPPVAHPLVRQLDDGRRSLFISEGFTTEIVGKSADESQALLARLFAHQSDPRFLYRHHWQPGDALLWDNRSTLHFATGCAPEHRRTLYRTTIRGPVPQAVAA